MGIEMLKGAVLGAALQEGPKQIAELVSKALKFKSTRRSLEYALEREIPVAQEMLRLNEELERPEQERTWLLDNLQEHENVLSAHSSVSWWQCCCLPCFQSRLEEALEAMTRCNINLLMPTMARNVQETLLTVREGIRGKPLKSLLKPPPKPDLVVGLGLKNPLSPFNKLKNQLLETGTSVLVLTGLSGYGKTTLATQLCWDDRVRGKFGENILFLTVSKTPNLKTIVQSLFQHYGCVMPDLHPDDDDWRIIPHLKNLPKEIMKSPMLLVLDDVWHGSEHLIDAFKVQQLSDYKILVTSRFNISGFELVCRMERLCLEDSTALFHRLALPNDGGSSLTKDYKEKLHLTEQIAKACCGSPLLLELVGGFLKRERVGVWRQMEEKLSEGCPIIESHTDLRSIFKKYLDHGLEDKPIIKECFMDLGLFPQDQKIPVAALIDIWTERHYKPDDDLDQTKKLKETDAVNLVYDLTDRHLANLVVRRVVAVDLDDYYNHHFLMQHDLYREMTEASQEPYKQRKRLMFDMNENNWSQQNRQNTVARTLSISTCEMSTPELGNIVKAEVVEVLVLNLCTNKYTFPEFIGKMKELKVLIVTNYDDFHYSELNNFELFDFLSGLKRIRLERVSVTNFGKWHNLRKLSLYNCIAREAFESDSIPISDALPKLVELCIDYCRDLEKLPAGLCDITSIEKLSITRCMVFIGLPQDIGKLKNLKILRLSSCAELKVIPTSIGNLRQLCFLDISGCVSLDDLPEQIGELLNLERLHMTGCSCKMLPSSVTKLKKLKNVICDEETAMYWKDFETSLPNLKIEEANDHSLFISYDNI